MVWDWTGLNWTGLCLSSVRISIVVSSIQYSVSSIQNPISGIQYPASSIQYLHRLHCAPAQDEYYVLSCTWTIYEMVGRGAYSMHILLHTERHTCIHAHTHIHTPFGQFCVVVAARGQSFVHVCVHTLVWPWLGDSRRGRGCGCGGCDSRRACFLNSEQPTQSCSFHIRGVPLFPGHYGYSKCP